MKPETQQRFKRAGGSFLLALAASSVFLDLIDLLPMLKGKKLQLQSAAKRAARDCANWPDSKLPERAGIALCRLQEIFATSLADSGTFQLPPEREGEVLKLLAVLFRALAARPGRPQLNKYRSAAVFSVENKASVHELCKKFEPSYSSMSREEQQKARARMRVGVRRILAASTNSLS